MSHHITFFLHPFLPTFGYPGCRRLLQPPTHVGMAFF